MIESLRATTECLIRQLEDRREADQGIIARARLLLEASEPEPKTVTPLKLSLDLGAVQEEARQLRTSLFEERRLLRMIREERDALAVQVGQLLERAERAERLLARAQVGVMCGQGVIGVDQDSKAPVPSDPVQHGLTGPH